MLIWRHDKRSFSISNWYFNELLIPNSARAPFITYVMYTQKYSISGFALISTMGAKNFRFTNTNSNSPNHPNTIRIFFRCWVRPWFVQSKHGIYKCIWDIRYNVFLFLKPLSFIVNKWNECFSSYSLCIVFQCAFFCLMILLSGCLIMYWIPS